MNNRFNFQINDYAYAGMFVVRLNEETFQGYVLNPEPTELLTPIPFSHKVLAGITGAHRTYKDRRHSRWHFFDLEVYRDKDSKLLYIKGGDDKIVFRHLHQFQGYLRKKFNYEICPDDDFTSIASYINDLYLVRDYEVKNGTIVFNPKAFKTRMHFGYDES